MKILEINSCNFGSTGNIMLQITQTATHCGHTAFSAVPASRSNGKKKVAYQLFIGTRFSRNLHLAFGKFTGLNGCFSVFSTLSFLHKIDMNRPDLIHLHNLHNSYINIAMLFRYIKKHHIPVVWTLHDCWAFTGQCPYFTMIKCEKWRTGCYDCPSYREYPQSVVDRTKIMWKLKKKWFTGVEHMTIVTPSQWLADLVKQSFLKNYPVKVIHNGIDLSVFKPTESNFREKHGISVDKFILLGVAFGWGKRKGLDIFIELSQCLNQSMYQIVLVGTDDAVDKLLPDNIISIHRTQNQKELAEIYTAADLFVNPTREENYPTVNMESIACGTPVVTFKTGGSPEIINEQTGIVTEENSVNCMIEAIELIHEKKEIMQDGCIKRSIEFDMNNKSKEYMELFLEQRLR